MFDLMTRTWWVLVLRGLAAVAFGIVALTLPDVTLATLVMVFGAYVLVEGLLTLYIAIRGWKERDDRWLMLIAGVLGVAIGVLTFRAPAITAVALLLYIAAWALVIGALNIVQAIRLRKHIQGELWLVLSGIAGILFAVIALWNPIAGALSLVWVIGAYAIVYGALLLALGIELKLARGRLPATPGTPTTTTTTTSSATTSPVI
jgi:uncharacterized membrane protein HdeD (DUF308 family)